MFNKRKLLAFSLLLYLIVISLYKDEITPDYKNTPSAYFLNPKHNNYLGVLQSHRTYPQFWILAYLYSLSFVIIPYLVVRLLYSKEIGLIALYLLSATLFVEYFIVWAEIPVLVERILPKINRYFHSPIICLFLIAAFTLLKNADSKTH